MAFDTLQKSHCIVKILTICGILTNNKLLAKLPKFQPICYKLLLHVPLTFTFTLLMWLEVSFSSDLSQATDALYVTLTETGLLVKILSVWYYEVLVKSLFNEWQQNEMFRLQTIQECAIWERRTKVYSHLVFLYIGFSLIATTCACTSVLFLNSYQLPFPIWLPFDWKSPLNYWCVYVYELFAMPLTCLSNSTLDTFFCFMIQHLALHFKMIALRLKALGNNQKDGSNTDVTKRLIAIIELHLKLKR